MNILAIESSGRVASCALIKENNLTGEIFINQSLQHSTILMPIIDDLLKLTETDIDEIDAVAVSGGPGSFTGLRIGVSLAKGIAQGGDKKFLSVSSLDALAFQQAGFNGIICPMIDALRDNIYTGLYHFEKGELVKVKEICAVHIDDIIEDIKESNENVIFCGDASILHRDRLIQKLKDKAFFSTISTTWPKASSIAELALKRSLKGIEEDIFTYSPIYLRKSQAEREYDKKRGLLDE